MTALHEDIRRENEVEGSSDRAFGLTVGGILFAIAAWWTLSGGFGWLEGLLGAVGLALVVAGAVVPPILAPLNRLWIRLGLLIGKVVSPIALGIIYWSTIVPVGLILRLRGKDLLRLRREPQLDTYWIVKNPPGPPPASITRQF